MLKTIITISQIIIAAAMVTSILLQKRGAAVGSAFGGDGAVYFRRRGAEQKLFIASLVLSCLFLLFAFIGLLIG